MSAESTVLFSKQCFGYQNLTFDVDRLEKELKQQEEEQQKRQRKEAQRRQQEEEERQRKWHEQEEQWKKQAEELRREKEKQEEQEYLRQKLQEEQRRCREQEQQRQKAEKQRQQEQQRQQQQQQQQQRGREQQRKDQKQEKADGERSRGGFFGRWRAKSEPAKEQKRRDGPQASAPKGSQWTRWPGADMPRAASTEDKARSAKETEERAAREKMQKVTGCGEVLGAVAEVQLRGRRLAFVFLHGSGSERVRVVFDRRLFDSSSSELPFPSKSLHADTVRVEVQQTEGGKDLFGLRWFRLLQEVPAGSTPGIPERPKSSSSSWVCCPLCPATSMRRFSLDRGLHAHLDAVHREGEEPEEAWHRKIAAMAEARGIFAHRSAEGLGGARRSAFINSRTTTDDRRLPPALEAARTGDVTTLEGLLREGWQPFRAASLDKHGASALDWAAGNGHMECVDLILNVDPGYALKATRRDGRGPFHWAAQGGHNSVLRRLLQCKVHPDARTTAGVTMMMFASYGGHMETCDFLLSQRADLWLQNAYGCDAGHFAAMGGGVAICQWLLQQGMCFSRPQRSGHTALDKAVEFRQEDVIKYLAHVTGAGAEESRR
ncbi:RAI14 [Symbiodinium sp. CCMP2592]|nr:RAI14 [Symbiodinium sp. CCMP2592]